MLLCWIAGGTVLLLQRPLDAPGLWWDLARGRQVCSGTVSPSSDLLTLDSANDADWFGGVPFFLAWSLAGIHALAAIPLVAGTSLVCFARRHVPTGSEWRSAVLFLPLWLWVARGGLQPVPELFDLLGLVTLWRLLQVGWPERKRMWAVCITFAVWANVGPRPLWGLLLLMFFACGGRTNLKLLAAAVLGGTLSPRGIYTWCDSAMLCGPLLFESRTDIAPAEWRGIFSDGNWSDLYWETSQLAFALLWVAAVVERMGRRKIDVPQVARWCVPLLMALICRSNLPLCGTWIVLDFLQPSPPNASPAPSTMPRIQRAWLALTAAVIFCLGLVDASGRGLFPHARLGWGIAHELDPRLLDASLLSHPEEELVGWAPDGRSTGMVAWLDGDVRMADHPRRALLGGRWPKHVDLVHDFVGQHRARYRRDDGTWGGFVQRLTEWKVDLLCVPAEDIELHAALFGTPWQPGDLDSPTVPYVSASDDHFSDIIVEVLRQQGFVEAGPWQPSADIYDGQGWRYDIAEVAGLGVDPRPAIRQSAFFRALHMPLASLRALRPVRRETAHRSLEAEFLACQEDLAYQEWLSFGQASLFRRLVVNRLAAVPYATDSAPWFALDFQESPAELTTWNSCVEAYLSANPDESLAVLPLDSSQQRFAAAMIWLELGEVDRALQELQHIAATDEDLSMKIAAKYWEERIAPYVSR